MRFYLTADLHYGSKSRGDRATRELAAHVAAHPLDGVIVAGDIGKDAASTRACLELFSEAAGFKLAVPGNHDVWTPGWEGGAGSWTIHEELLPSVMRQAGFHPLHIEPHVVGEVAFVGSMGWYDYSFRDDIGIPLENYRAKTPPGRSWPLWNDARYADFDVDDEALTGVLAERLSGQLSATSGAARVVGVVHHCATKRLLVHPRAIVPKMWRFANAFLGSERFHEAFVEDGRARKVYCGHIHMEKTTTVEGISYTSVGSDYKKKQLLVASAEGVEEALMFG